MSAHVVAPPAEVTAPPKRSKFMKFLKMAAIAVLLFVGVVLAAASSKPAVFRVERSIHVAAPADRIAPHLVDLKKWATWSPWEKVDPEMKRTYGGAESGVGAKYAWDGDNNIGAGSLEVTESTPEKVAFNLDFLRPMQCHNIAEFAMTPAGDGTKLTWMMEGPNTFMGKVAQVFLDVHGMVGKQFDEGLGNLKSLAEAK